ncbi:MAG: HDOD domain-containing protein [Deltaproteobacteria bacterium]|nr:HDOD domain-containing protein [Deltaproteobacteria bacterium]
MAKNIRYGAQEDMTEIDKILSEIVTLKPVSHIAHRVIDLCCDPQSSLRELVEVIKYDQSITANLLRVCNSSYFGLMQKIVSVQQAVAYLGLSKVANLVVMGSTAYNFKTAQKGYDLGEGELWQYSVASAIIAQDLAEKKRLGNISLVFTSALLKDIGKLILHTYVKDSFEEINTAVQTRGLSFIEAEKEIIGIDHAGLGAKVAESWNFPPVMVDIIRNHHNPNRAPSDDPNTPIVYLADSICMMIGVGLGADGLAYRYYQEIVNRLDFSSHDLQKTIAAFWEKIKGVQELVNLSGGGR